MHNNYQFKLPTDSIVFLNETKDGIMFSQMAKDFSGPIKKNRAWNTLNAIKLEMTKGSHFTSENFFGAAKIFDIAEAIYARYETRYNESLWNSIVDTFTSCFGIKSDLDKMQDLLNEILNHSKVKINQIKPAQDDGREDGSGQLSESEDSQEFEISNEETSEEISDQKTISENFSEIDFKENIPLIFEKSEEHLLTFLSEKVFLVQPRTLNISTLRLLKGLTEIQIQSLVELNKKFHICESMLETICFAIGSNESTYKTADAAVALVNAFFQAEPDSTLWEKFNRNPVLAIPINVQKTIRVLNLQPQDTISNDDLEQAVAAVRSSFKPIEHWRLPFEEYTHRILSHIVTLNKSEGSEVAQLQLQLFIKAIIPADHKDVEHTHTFDLISRAVHLDKDPISECCKHLPITPDFKLTPIILKTLIAEYAKNQSHWNHYVMHRIETQDQALALLEAALELPEKQKNTLLSAIYHSIYKRGVFQVLFEEKGLKTENYPILPPKAYNTLFTPTPFQLYDFSKDFLPGRSEEDDLNTI